MSQFLRDVLKGLSSKEKYLQSKYFYDETGDRLFQKIMGCHEYYLTRAELEIFTQKTGEIISVLTAESKEFDIVELGAGDATKSTFLLKALLDQNFTFNYFPVDISANVINQLQQELPQRLPELNFRPLHGEYFQMLQQVKSLSEKTKVVLFLGSNIGNVALEKAGEFTGLLRKNLNPGDLLLIGIDLKKDPLTILDAYNDRSGYTRDFNLNLLTRINRELSGNFDRDQFYHFPNYDPGTGACKSHLVSRIDQTVSIQGNVFGFKEGETVFMEISQKYTLEQCNELASQSGFMPVNHFFDSKKWFLDAVWKAV